jgi:23S rRNA pseudouridine2605 synthase
MPPPKPAGTRLQKILARAGIASRRHAEELISAGRVRVNGRIATELGTRANARHDRVEVDGKRVIAEDLVYVVLHKPRGVVSTMADPEGRLTVRDYLKDVPGRVYPVGRLDYATSGVLLATNDGDFAEALLHPRKAAPKTYVVKVNGLMADKHLAHWSAGVELEDGKTLPARVTLIRHEDGKTWLELTIQEGRNQQIRRMGEATGFSVMRLSRTSFAGVTSEGLRPGTWRPLTTNELQTLKKAYGVPKVLPVAFEAPEPPSPRARRPWTPSGRLPRHRDGDTAPPAPRPGRGELGRGGRGTRTTGTGGGIGAHDDAEGFALSRRRGR